MSDSAVLKEEAPPMPETLSKSDTALPSKRKLDQLQVSQIEEKEETNQPSKLQSLSDNGNEEKSTESKPLEPVPISSIHVEKTENDAVSEEEDEDEDDDVDYDNDDAEEEGNPVVDRKGKGIMIEEEDDDDSDCSDDDGDDDDDDDEDDDEMDGGDDGDSDLDDDPLAEVDLDNILQSRTRRKAVNPGVFIGKGTGKVDDAHGNDGDT